MTPKEIENDRQQQIMDHKKTLYNQEFLKLKQMQQQQYKESLNSQNDSDSRIDINPNIDRIINDTKKDIDSRSESNSRITNVNTVDADEATKSNVSIKRRKPRQKKSGIVLS